MLFFLYFPFLVADKKKSAYVKVTFSPAACFHSAGNLLCIFSEAAGCVVINETELRVKTLNIAEVSLSKVLNSKQLRERCVVTDL